LTTRGPKASGASFDGGGEDEPAAEDDGASEESSAVESTRFERPQAPTGPGGFETLSLLDLDDDGPVAAGAPAVEANDDGGRGRRRRRRGRGKRRGGEGARSADDDEEEPAAAAAQSPPVDDDDHTELPELADAPEELSVDVPRYEDEEEEPESELDRIRRERERRRRERAQSRDGASAAAEDGGEVRAEERGLPRGRVAIVAHADRESIVAAVLLAREMRQLEGVWIYPQEDLMTFFRGVATDLRDDTPIYLLGFAAKPARDAIQAANLYQGRLVWFDHHEWPPEDLGAMRAALGESYAQVSPGSGSVLPLVLPHCGRRSRFSDKLVELATGRFSQHDFERWGRVWWQRLGQSAQEGRAPGGARAADRRATFDSRWKPSAATPPVPPGGRLSAVISDGALRGCRDGGRRRPRRARPHLALRIARERFALLGLDATRASRLRARQKTTPTAGRRRGHGRAPEREVLGSRRPDDDHVARIGVKGLASDPGRFRGADRRDRHGPLDPRG
jgi:hypothetical protein